MQCANLVKKRRVETELGYRAKRVCVEAELRLADCPMEMSNTLIVSSQHQQQVSVVRPRLCCPRCLGGEPGHINHIMGH